VGAWEGRRVGGGQWIVSKVALAMLLDGDHDALPQALGLLEDFS
jgi:hypothetical protein